MLKASLLSLALFMSFTLGCGGQSRRLPIDGTGDPAPTPTPAVITAAQVFSNTAQTLVFQNGYGDITTVEIIPVDANHSTWHYTKTETRAYWAPGVAQAELFFDLERDATSAWYSTGGIMNEPLGGPNPQFPNPVIMQRYPVPQTAGQARPYLILPSATGFSYETTFTDTIPIGNGEFVTFPGTHWKASSYMEFVTTPMFTGMAYVSDQWEGPCIHEKWWFAPGIGMVKVAPILEGVCSPSTDTNLVMVRIK
jgi:hypothetical protein